MKLRKKKRALTLLEIMIVIVLIGLIGSVIGVNMKGSLEKGKAFKTRLAMEQIKDIFALEMSQGATVAQIVENPATYLEHSGLIKKPKEFIKDGWGVLYEIKAAGRAGSSISVTSAKLEAYDQRQRQKVGAAAVDPEPEAANDD